MERIGRAGWGLSRGLAGKINQAESGRDRQGLRPVYRTQFLPDIVYVKIDRSLAGSDPEAVGSGHARLEVIPESASTHHARFLIRPDMGLVSPDQGDCVKGQPGRRVESNLSSAVALSRSTADN